MYSSAFGFTAALLEGLPIVGLIFTISNRVGAAMWAHGLFFLLPLPRSCLIPVQTWKNANISLRTSVHARPDKAELRFSRCGGRGKRDAQLLSGPL
jgi:hypothetical protein